MKALNLLYSTINFFIQTTWLNRIIFYTAVITGCVVAFAPAEAGLQPGLNDKFMHAVGFIIIALLSHLAHPYLQKRYHIIGLSLLGLLIEVVQAYLPYRDFSLWDWCADMFGVVVYFLALSAPLNIFFKHARQHKYVPD